MSRDRRRRGCARPTASGGGRAGRRGDGGRRDRDGGLSACCRRYGRRRGRRAAAGDQRGDHQGSQPARPWGRVGLFSSAGSIARGSVASGHWPATAAPLPRDYGFPSKAIDGWGAPVKPPDDGAARGLRRERPQVAPGARAHARSPRPSGRACTWPTSPGSRRSAATPASRSSRRSPSGSACPRAS